MGAFSRITPAVLAATTLLWLTGTVIGFPASAQAVRTLTLEQALALAEQHSPVLQASRQDVKAAEAQHQIAQSAYLPKVEAVETFTNTNNPTLAFGTLLNQGRFTQAGFDINNLNRPGTVENYRFALSLVQPVYNGGRERLGVAMAEIGQSASAQGLESTRQQVLFSVTRSYYDLVLAKAVVGVTRDTVSIAESNAKQIQSRYERGLTVKSDVLQAEVRLAALREEAIRADQRMRVATMSLRHAIGLNEEVDTSEILTQEEAVEKNLEATIARALEERPDFLMLLEEVRKAGVGIKMAKSAFLPNLNLQTSYELNNTAPFSQNGSNNYIALGVLSFNLFNGMGDAAAVRKARAQENRAREWLAAKRRAIEVEVVEAFYGLAAARQRLKVSEQAVAQAEENLRIVRNRYNNGIAPVIDLLNAEIFLNQARQNRMGAIYDDLVGRFRLDLVAGQLTKVSG